MAAVETTRSFIDYALARRATLAALFGGRATVTDVCDAHPYLLQGCEVPRRADRRAVPGLRKDPLTHVTYTYGDALGQYSGRIKATRELAQMEYEISEFTVYVVEVCQNCGWNHPARILRARPRRSRAGRQPARLLRRVSHSRERALSE